MSEEHTQDSSEVASSEQDWELVLMGCPLHYLCVSFYHESHCFCNYNLLKDSTMLLLLKTTCAKSTDGYQYV
jgi:hypothetical protein